MESLLVVENSQRLAGAQQHPGVRVAVLLPCYNEALTIHKVVNDFRASLPAATIYVYDNNSTDGTADAALAAGAVVRRQPRQGKGNVLRRMFADIEADVYVLADGDDTYDAGAAGLLIQLLVSNQLDFLNAGRATIEAEAYRPGHRLGNVMLTYLVRSIFGRQFKDMLSGYKVFSRRFAKSFPAMSIGFETETELAVHALELRMPTREVMTVYRARPEGSFSKLNTFRDGFRILMLILRLVKDERPIQFFSGAGVLVIFLGIGLGIPILVEYFQSGLVLRLPTAVLSMGLVLLGFLSIFTGLILDVVTRTRQEMKRLTYLSLPCLQDPNT
jgi:glycosyltransferase involved in cell wall biosynthesis